LESQIPRAMARAKSTSLFAIVDVSCWNSVILQTRGWNADDVMDSSLFARNPTSSIVRRFDSKLSTVFQSISVVRPDNFSVTEYSIYVDKTVNEVPYDAHALIMHQHAYVPCYYLQILKVTPVILHRRVYNQR
jgi:hypothetical protein